MTEADFEREAVKLFRQLGLKVGAESLDFFKGQSVLLSDWKGLFKHPQQSRSRLSSPSTATRESIMSSSPHHRMVQPLVLPTTSLDINSRGSISPTSHDSTDHEEEDDRDSEEEYFGDCAICEQPVIGEETGCLALDQVFHNMCFKCNKCYKVLSGGSFFVSDGLVLCEKDYLFTLDKCYTCKQVITQKIIRAIGHTYHPVCFRCNVCGLCLDGVPFAADFSNNVYCEKDFHNMFAPICAVCQDPIIPSPGKDKSKRLIAMNLSFHVECYRCLECNIPLATNQCSSSAAQCYPINEHPLCLQCNKLWSSRGQTKLDVPTLQM